MIKHELSQAQYRIFVTQKIYQDSTMYNIGGYLLIHGDIDIAKMLNVLNSILDDDVIFQLRLGENDSVYQYVEASVKDVTYENLSRASESSFTKWVETQMNINFQLLNQPLYRLTVFKKAESLYGILIVAHHIFFDGWSINLLIKRINERYESQNTCQNVPQYTYLDYIEEERQYLVSNKYVKNRSFFLEQLQNIDIAASEKKTDSSAKRICYCLGQNTARVKKLCTSKHISYSTLFLFLHSLHVYKLTGITENIVGIPVLGRTNKYNRNTLGMFVSPIPVYYDLSNSSLVSDELTTIERAIRNSYKNQRYPYNHLIKELTSITGSSSDLYDICINNYGTHDLDAIGGFGLEYHEWFSGYQPYSLQIVINELDNDLYLYFDHTDKYVAQDIQEMYEFFCRMIQSFENSDTLVNAISLLSKEDEERLLHQYNSTYTELDYRCSFVTEFTKQVKSKKSIVAMVDGSESLTYAALDKYSDIVMNFIKEHGIVKNSVIAIIMNPSVAAVVSMLGIMKAGCVFLPLDVTSPKDRIEYNIDDSKACMILYENVKPDISLNVDRFRYVDICSRNYPVITKDYDLSEYAYIIYTSGTTGKPKGSLIRQKGLYNYVHWAAEFYNEGKEVYPFYTSIAFDLTITSIFVPLISGNSIIVFREDKDENVLKRLINDQRLTILKATPSHLEIISDLFCANSAIKKLIIGGENLKASLCDKLCQTFGKELSIYNEYGPTETVVGCMIYKYKDSDGHFHVPIGRPINNTQIYVLDKDEIPVPVGVEGELYVSGDGVSEGYLNNPQLTSRAFLNKNGIIYYKTGDRAKFFDYGNIICFGRNDRQVKVRGHRVELNEIENVIQLYPTIRNAIVIFHNNKLKAYYQADAAIDNDELHRYIKSVLPQYMIPYGYKQIYSIPTTINGKMNIALLPEIESGVSDKQQTYSNEIIKVFEDVLRTTLSSKVNFYHIGGDSIKAIQISNRLFDKGIILKATDILTHAEMDQILRCVTYKKKNMIKGEASGRIEITPGFAWLLSQEGDKRTCTQWIKLRVDRTIPDESFEALYNSIMRSFSAFSVNYAEDEIKFYYNEDLRHREYHPVYLDYAMDIDQFILEKIQEDNWFSMSDELLKMIIISERDTKDVVFVAHHLAVDIISWSILIDEINKYINAFMNDQSVPMADQGISYQYWSNIVHKIYPIDANTFLNFYSKTARDSNQGIRLKQQFRFDTITYCELMQLAMKYNLSAQDILIYSISKAVCKWQIGHQILFELESYGRDLSLCEEVGHSIGWFTNFNPVIIDTDVLNPVEFFILIKQSLHCTLKNQWDYEYKKSIYKDWSDNGLFRIAFNYGGNLERESYSDISSCSFGWTNKLKHEIKGLSIDSYFEGNSLYIIVQYNSYLTSYDKNIDIRSFADDVVQNILNLPHVLKNPIYVPQDFPSVKLSQNQLDLLIDKVKRLGEQNGQTSI